MARAIRSLPLRIARSLLLVCVRHKYSVYFWVFWDSAIVVDMLQVYLMADILRALPGRNAISARSRYIFGFLALFLAIGSWTASMHTPGAMYLKVVSTVTLLNRSADVTWGVFTVACIFSISALGMGWRRQPAQIASGYLIDVIFRVYSSSTYAGTSWKLSALANEIGSTVSVAVCVYWLGSLALSQEQEQPSEDQTSKIRRFIESKLPGSSQVEGTHHV